MRPSQGEQMEEQVSTLSLLAAVSWPALALAWSARQARSREARQWDRLPRKNTEEATALRITRWWRSHLTKEASQAAGALAPEHMGPPRGLRFPKHQILNSTLKSWAPVILFTASLSSSKPEVPTSARPVTATPQTSTWAPGLEDAQHLHPQGHPLQQGPPPRFRQARCGLCVDANVETDHGQPCTTLQNTSK